MTIADRVAYSILKSIEAGYLKEGQILPTERELAKKFSVNRSTVREALKTLETFRYLQKTPGTGSTVLPKSNWSCESLIFKYNFANRIEPSTASEFVELLIIVEQASAELAFKNKTIQDLKNIESLYDQLLISSDPSNEDRSIHLYFSKLSNNTMYDRLLNALWIPIKKYSYLYHTSERKSHARKLLKNIIIYFKTDRRKLKLSIASYYHDALFSLLEHLSASD
jgi:DNA-binding FadR family transcriptional regulator